MAKRNKPLNKLLDSLLKIYKLTLSPVLKMTFGGSCKYDPTCSVFVHDELIKYGFLKGSIVSVGRMLRCNPLSKGGYDPA
jgi:putative membrane protein insertion efficiency factor